MKAPVTNIIEFDQPAFSKEGEKLNTINKTLTFNRLTGNIFNPGMFFTVKIYKAIVPAPKVRVNYTFWLFFNTDNSL